MRELLKRIRLILSFLNREPPLASFTSSSYFLACLWNSSTREHHASICLDLVSKLGWMVKKGGKLYCHGHWKPSPLAAILYNHNRKRGHMTTVNTGRGTAAASCICRPWKETRAVSIVEDHSGPLVAPHSSSSPALSSSRDARDC